MKIKRTSYRFTNRRGLNLAAQLACPEEPRAYALFSNCFTCTKDYKSSQWLGNALAEGGLGFFSFDFTGLGESEGEFANTNLDTMQDDLLSAAEFLRRNFQAPQLWVGYSLGGVAVLSVAARVEDARAVVSLATPAEFSGFRERLLKQDSDIETRGEGEIEWGGFRFRVRRQLFENLEKYSVPELARDLGKPWLILHSPQDGVVPFAQAEELYHEAQQPKFLQALEGLPHLLLTKAQIIPVSRAILDWAPSFIPALALSSPK